MLPRCSLLLALVACDGGGSAPGPAPAPTPVPKPGLQADVGVDAATRTIRIGMLNDASTRLGKAHRLGKRVLAARINAGGTGLLPRGWKVALVERDGDGPSELQAFEALRNDVLFVGTANAPLPLLEHLERDNVVAFPASTTRALATHTHTPPLGPSYQAEAERAVDFVVRHTPDKRTIRLCLVHHGDDFGTDAAAGFSRAAQRHALSVKQEQTVSAAQEDYAAALGGLEEARCTHVLLAVRPTVTGPLLRAATKHPFGPVWIGNTPAWSDTFFNKKVHPHAVFANYYQMNGIPFWSEPVPGMKQFEKAFEAHGGGEKPDVAILTSYIHGLAQIEAARRAIERGNITRAGYLEALHSLDAFDADGMIQPMDLSETPYPVSDRVRVLKPDFENKTWTEFEGWAAPGMKPEPSEYADKGKGKARRD